MFIYHFAQVVNDLCCQIGFTIVFVFYQVVILVLKEFYACVFDFYQCACPVFIVANVEPDSVILAWYQNTVHFFAIAFFVQFAILLLCIWANFTKLLVLNIITLFNTPKN